MLRSIFSRRRRLLGELCHIVERLLIEAYTVASVEGRPALILFIQTFGDLLTFNPHIHVLAADGVFCADGVFVVLPAIPVKLFEREFRSEVLKLLVAEGAIGERLSASMPVRRIGAQVQTLSVENVRFSWHRSCCMTGVPELSAGIGGPGGD